MRLLVLTTMFPSRRNPSGGIFLADSLRALRPLVEDIVVVSPRLFVPRWLPICRKWQAHNVDQDQDEWEGLPVLRPRLPMIPGAQRAWWTSRLTLPWLRRFIRPLNRPRPFDWLIGYSLFPCGQWAAALRGLVPHTAAWAIGSDVHTVAPMNARTRRAAARTLASVDLVLCVSEYIRRLVRELAPGKDNAVTFYEGIDTRLFEGLPPKPALRAALGLDPHRKYLVYVGALTEAKGLPELWESFETVAASHPDWGLILVGPGRGIGALGVVSETLRDRAARSGLQDRVVFAGHLPHTEVPKYLAAADMFVFPTRAEAIGTVLLEAGAAGLPIVSTDAGGNREFIGQDEAGLLVPVRNAKAMTAAIERLIADPALRAKCAAEAKRRAFESFSAWRNAGRLRDILQGAAADQGLGGRRK